VSTGPEKQFEVSTSDGLKLHSLVAAPAAPRAVLVACHGITTDHNEHGAFRRLRDAALRAGLALVRFDFRAHGRSEGTNEELRLAGYRADADAILELAERELGPELPVIPLGVSFGGAAAAHMASRARRCAGLALWYAVVDYVWNFGPDSPVPFTIQMRAATSESKPDWAAMPLADTGYHLPAAMVGEMPDDRTPELIRGLNVPVVGYYGARDKLVDPAPLRRIAAERPNVVLRIVPGAGHGFLLWRPWVIGQTVRWASRVASAAGA
jgi:pimeloyl-ACP methyl ester carboxylesterase